MTGERAKGVTPAAPAVDADLLIGSHTYGTVTDRITGVVLNQRNHPGVWFAVFALAFLLLNGMK
ncbi:MAG: hypothetical protein FJX72_20090, partial [Armatimonadetes bacterium]|nr:hypothetical protein [Armatimonadota bacterium]